MSPIEHWRDSMLKPEQEPRWSINGHTMIAEGPWLKNAGRIEVVPAEQFRGAVEAVRELAGWLDDLGGIPDHDDAYSMRDFARQALDRLGGAVGDE